jgi:hypothetical protein
VAQNSITDIEHPPYSPDLAMNDFSLFPNLQSALKGRKFQDIEDIQKKYGDGTESFSTTGVSKLSNCGSIVGLSA